MDSKISNLVDIKILFMSKYVFIQSIFDKPGQQPEKICFFFKVLEAIKCSLYCTLKDSLCRTVNLYGQSAVHLYGQSQYFKSLVESRCCGIFMFPNCRLFFPDHLSSKRQGVKRLIKKVFSLVNTILNS